MKNIKYFNNPQNLEDLKNRYRQLAMKHHPDMNGGTAESTEIMKAVNNEYDALFPIYKAKYNAASATPCTETAAGTRSQFYTQNGWTGENYNSNISTKEIAFIMRAYIKDVHNNYRFGVRSEYNHIYITMTEAPEKVFTDGSMTHAQLNQYCLKEDKRLTESAKNVMTDILNLLNSYRMDDSDSLIDYFDTNFYISLSIGEWDKPLKIVGRAKKAAEFTEYESVEVTKTRVYKTLEVKDIEKPAEYKTGQFFQLKVSYTYGRRKGYVYRIDKIEGGCITAYKMDRKYKKMCKGSDTKYSFFLTVETLDKWVEKGAVSFVELAEVSKREDYTSRVRRAKKQTGVSTYLGEFQHIWHRKIRQKYT